MTSTPLEHGDPLVDQLFGEFLGAEEKGVDLAGELVARAGEKGSDLARRIRIHRDLYALSSALGSDAEKEDPRAIGRFQILSRLGEGGLGVVYLAHDPLLARRVALKVLDKRTSLGKRAWVLREARSLARLEHPGVVRVFEVGETDEVDTIAMEHLPGPSLELVIAELRALRDGRARTESPLEVRLLAERLLPFSARVACLARIADALAYCHDRGILHRDIKPANVLFDRDGQPRLIDFGLAHLEDAEEASSVRLTQELIGTPAYIAPEQVELGRIGADPRSDQFSFSVLAYELLALTNPFDRGRRTSTLDAIVLARPPALRSVDPAIPADLARVVHHGLEPSPEDRYPALSALAADLEAVSEHRSPSVQEPSLHHIARLWLRRHRKAALTAAGAAAVLSMILVLAWSAGTLRWRANLLAELEAIEVDTARTPSELGACVTPLFELERAAQDYDAGWLRARVWGGVGERVQDVVQRWSRRLGEVHHADRTRSEEEHVPFQESAFRRLFTREEQLCPECPDNREERNRGRVLYPEAQLEGLEWELTLMTPLTVAGDALAAFRPTERVDEPIPGLYRLRAWRDGSDRLAHELDFYVPEGGPLGRHIEFRAPREEFLQLTVVVEADSYPVRDGSARYPVLPFRILGRTISIDEFERFAREEGWTPSLREHGADGPGDAPARVDLESALRFAAWAGGRLPSAVELWCAVSQGAIELPAHSSLAGGEHVVDLMPTSSHHNSTIFRYGTQSLFGEPPADFLIKVLGFNPGRTCPAWPPVGQEMGLFASMGFRLAFSDGNPEELHELALRPLVPLAPAGEVGGTSRTSFTSQ